MNNFRECFQVDNTQKKTNYHLYSISYRDCMRLLRDSSVIFYNFFKKFIIYMNIKTELDLSETEKKWEQYIKN